MNPRREASERVDGAYEVRVLEPSPPPVTDGPWFADDPVTRGESPAGTPIVSPVTTGDVTWDELSRDDPELAGWCGERWLGAWRPLPPLPARTAFVSTRAAWHMLAEHVLSRARYNANGKIGLRYTRRGVGTPWFRHRDRDAQVRIEGTNVVVHEDGETQSAPVTTVAAAAELAGVQPGAPRGGLRADDVVHAGRTARARRTQRRVPRRVVRVRDLRTGAAARRGGPCRRTVTGAAVARALRPLGRPRRRAAGRRGTFGASPGDDVDRDPYLYVTHWADVAEDEFWNEAHFPGASLTVVTLADASDQRASALRFLRRGRDLLPRPLTTYSGSSGVSMRSSTTSRNPARSR